METSATGRGSARGPWLGLLLCGLGLWVVYRLGRPDDPSRVTVSPDTVAALADGLARQHGRPATEAELDAEIEQWIDREILVREARARGLDRDDPIVRRRLVQSMGFVLEGEAGIAEDPGDAVLQAFVDAQPEAYRRPPRRGFTHAFFSGHDAATEARAEALAQARREGAAEAGEGEAFPHGTRQAPVDRETLAQRYGDPFAAVVEAAPRDRWLAAESAFGWHVLRIDREQPGQRPPLAEIRARVLTDWRQQQRDAARLAGQQRLRERYEVQVIR